MPPCLRESPIDIRQPHDERACSIRLQLRDGAGAALTLNATFTPAANPADIDGNGEVNGADLATLLSSWG